MTNTQTTALSALGGAALGGLGGAMIATQPAKRVLWGLGGVILGAVAGGVTATVVQNATASQPKQTTGAGAAPQITAGDFLR